MKKYLKSEHWFGQREHFAEKKRENCLRALMF